MRLEHLMLSALTVTVPFSAPAQKAADSDGMSPEGRAVVVAFYRNPDPALRKCFDERRDIELQLIREGEKSTFDWPNAKSLLERDLKTQMNCLILLEKKSIELLDNLPASDRAKYFRAQHRIMLPPTITSPQSKTPSK